MGETHQDFSKMGDRVVCDQHSQNEVQFPNNFFTKNLQMILGNIPYCGGKMIRGDFKIQVAATTTVCSRLQNVAILLFQFKQLGKIKYWYILF